MKEYQVVINREYTTYITLRFPDDGTDHKEKINECLESGDDSIWDLIYEKELEQMEVNNENWEIYDSDQIAGLGESEINTTRTGALSNDTGPRS